MKKKNPVGRPTTYKPEYCQMLIDFFDEPFYTIKDITITTTEGKSVREVDKTEMEALPPVFLSGFAKAIGVSLLGYRRLFHEWAEKFPDFANALKVGKELELQRIKVNAQMGLYAQAFSIFTMKNITYNKRGEKATSLIEEEGPWRDKTELTGAGGEALIPKPIVKIDYEKVSTDELVATLQEQIKRTA